MCYTDILELLARRMEEKEGTGAAVAVLHGHRLSVLAHGTTKIQGQESPSGNSIFQIASLTKIFTSLLLADAVRRQEVALDDRLERYLPVPSPPFDAQSITLVDLATHTSGLPLRPASRVDRSQDDPYSNYSEADLTADLAAVRLNRPPGSVFEYSNFGYGLLGEALCRRTGNSYSELLRTRILEPLDLEETALIPTVSMRHRLVQGYDLNFEAAHPWSFGALAPAGALFSSLNDLAKILQLFLGDTYCQPLAASASFMLTVDRPGDDSETRMALGWRRIKDASTTKLWSSGNAGGIRSFMGYCPDRSLGVIGFINKASSAGVDDICLHLLDSAE
jgi:D-alanyl-D-alanine-carboxypeptidase/D-alanyl-D-alanine-endopeptidase